MGKDGRDKKINEFARELGGRIDAGDYGVGDDPRWGVCMRRLGFEMDCWHSFEEAYGIPCGDPRRLEPVLDGIDDVQLLGNAAFSQWRYINHWAMGDTADGFRVLRMLLGRLEELTRD